MVPGTGALAGQDGPAARSVAVNRKTALTPVLPFAAAAASRAPPPKSSVMDAKHRAPAVIFTPGAVAGLGALPLRKGMGALGAGRGNAAVSRLTDSRKEVQPPRYNVGGSAGRNGAPAAVAPGTGTRQEQSNVFGELRKQASDLVPTSDHVGSRGTRAPSPGMHVPEPSPRSAAAEKQGKLSLSLQEGCARSAGSMDVDMEGGGHYVDVDVKLEPVSDDESSDSDFESPSALLGERSHSRSMFPADDSKQRKCGKDSTGAAKQGSKQRLQDAATAVKENVQQGNRVNKAGPRQEESIERPKQIKVDEHRAVLADISKEGDYEEAQVSTGAFAKQNDGSGRLSGALVISKQSGRELYQVSAAELAKQSRAAKLQGSAAAVAAKQIEEMKRGPAFGKAGQAPVKIGQAARSKVRAKRHKRATPSSPSGSSPPSSSTSSDCTESTSSDSDACSSDESDESARAGKSRAPARRPSGCVKKEAEANSDAPKNRHLLRDNFGRFAKKKRRLVKDRDPDAGSKRRRLESPEKPASMPASSGARVKASAESMPASRGTRVKASGHADASDVGNSDPLNSGRAAEKRAGFMRQPVPRGSGSTKGDALSKCLAPTCRSAREGAATSSLTREGGSVGHKLVKRLDTAAVKAAGGKACRGEAGAKSRPEQQRVREMSCDSVRSPEQPKVETKKSRRRRASEGGNAKKKLKPFMDAARLTGKALWQILCAPASAKIFSSFVCLLIS